MAEGRRPSQSDRIAALEEGYRSIGRELGQFRDEVKHDVGELRRTFTLYAEEMRRENTARSKIPWQGIGVIVSILVALVALGGWGVLKDLTRGDRKNEQQDESILQIQKTRWSDQDARDQSLRLERRIERAEALDKERHEAAAALARERRDHALREREWLRNRIIEHQKDGHPNRVEEIVRGVEKRLEALERRGLPPAAK